MKRIAMPWETWRVIINALRAKALPSMRQHADHLDHRLEQYTIPMTPRRFGSGLR